MSFKLFSRDVDNRRPILVNTANVVYAVQGASADKPIDESCVLLTFANSEAIYVDGTLESVAAALTAADEPEAKARKLVRLEGARPEVGAAYVDPRDVLRIGQSGIKGATYVAYASGGHHLTPGTPDEVARALGLAPEVP